MDDEPRAARKRLALVQDPGHLPRYPSSVARFYSTNAGTTRLVTALGTWDLTEGLPLDVDDEVAEVFKEAFLRGELRSQLIAQADSPPAVYVPPVPTLIPDGGMEGDFLWTTYNVNAAPSTVWVADGYQSMRLTTPVQNSNGGAFLKMVVPYSATWTFTMDVNVLSKPNARGAWAYIEFYNGTTWLSGEYTDASTPVASGVGQVSCIADAPPDTTHILIGVECGDPNSTAGSVDMLIDNARLTAVPLPGGLFANTALNSGTVLIATGY